MDENDMKKKFFFNTKSPAYRRALEDCERVAASNVNVLLIGESGSGLYIIYFIRTKFRY